MERNVGPKSQNMFGYTCYLKDFSNINAAFFVMDAQIILQSIVLHIHLESVYFIVIADMQNTYVMKNCF